MTEQKYEDLGSICIEEADDANIPVNSFLEQIDPNDPDSNPEYRGWFQWTASNFIPRKMRVDEGTYEIVAREKKTILDLVRKHVAPLYEAALENLRESGENYYWKRKE